LAADAPRRAHHVLDNVGAGERAPQAVLLLRTATPSQESILKLFLYVGAFCFVVAVVAPLVAQHFAPDVPKLQEEVNNLKTELKAERDRPAPAPDFSKQREVLDNVVKTMDPSVEELKQINGMALDNGCPGGAHGLPISHGGDIAARSSNVMANLNNAKSNIVSVIHSLP
jgi:hypothetical protein